MRIYSYHNFHQHRPSKHRWFSFSSLFKKRQTPTMLHSAASSSFHKFKNPYNRRKKGDWGRIIKFAILPTLFVLWLALILYLPYFRVTKFSYQGLKMVKREEIEDYVKNSAIGYSRIIPLNNYFLISTKKILNKIEEKFSFSTVKITKIFPDEIKIEMEEKISAIIYDNGNQYYILDQDGTLLKYLPMTGDKVMEKNNSSTTSNSNTVNLSNSMIINSSTSIFASTTIKEHVPNYVKILKDFGNYPILYDQRPPAPISEKQSNVIPANIIKAVTDFNSRLNKEGIVRAKYFSMNNPSAGISVYTDQPWKIIFQPENDIDSQINNLKLILQNNSPLEYIDLRFGERVYWK